MASPRDPLHMISAHPGPEGMSQQPVPAAVRREAIRQSLRGRIMQPYASGMLEPVIRKKHKIYIMQLDNE